MYDLTSFQRDILYVTAGLTDPHGLAIKDALEDYYESNVQHGHLYPNLDSLVESGHLDKGRKDRRTNVYTVTDDGMQALVDRREWEDRYVSE